MRKLRTIEMKRLTHEEYPEKMPLVVVLDDVRSMHYVSPYVPLGVAVRALLVPSKETDQRTKCSHASCTFAANIKQYAY